MTAIGFALLFFVLFYTLHNWFPPKIEIRYAQFVEDSKGKVIHAFLSDDDKWRMKSEFKDISPQLKLAILEKEDKYFYHHPGVNPAALARAAFNNFIYHKKTSGASTITMQVARMLEPKERNYLNKVIEIFRALQLEFIFSKDELLVMYLNLVPYGGNIEGIKAASLLYFGKLPDQLSLAQVTALTIIPNRPTSLRPGVNNDRIIVARNYWLKRFRINRIFPQKEIDDALAEPFTAKRVAPPKEAPHFSWYLKKKYPNEPIIRSTLNSSMQALVAQLSKNYMVRLQDRHISNVAVLLINNQSHDIEAYLGSGDYGDKAHAGQVNGVVATRSPGSTLKPLVYAMAFDKGLVTPKSLILDIPTDFGGYAPDNFDKKFHGKVTVEQSLAYSLNIPAVKTLQDVGVAAFINCLRKAGFQQIKKKQAELGLSMILGGCGINLAEITQLFSAFANEGRFHEAGYLLNADFRKAAYVQLISPASAYILTDILSQIDRPDLPNKFESNYHIPKVSWKTGTSYGRRDAWSIGYNKNYTLGVWVGNFSGEGVPELTGADIATPLLFELFNSVDYNPSAQWNRIPKDLSSRFVCEESGNVPEDFCDHVVSDYFIPKISSSVKCKHLKKVWVSPDESYRYCATCLPETGYKVKLYKDISSELKNYYKSQNIPFSPMPLHNPYCLRVLENKGLSIVSPAAGSVFMVDKEEPAELLLRCNAPSDVTKLFWYINNKLFKEAEIEEKVFFHPPGGKVKISCADDQGRHTDIFIDVVYQ